ncbi:peptidase S66 [Xenorhabdus miraniensis]|uniref:Peptidase S66 n=2 Tax=Xenorhabdus miraniensis TaxID=351674 RepID=A0A2D0JPI0_9GAMM|nr:peptidase S66 [Xenorhabdus miraniensis]
MAQCWEEQIERVFAHLLLYGTFNKTSAIILGKHGQFNDRGTGRNFLNILKEVLNNREVTILADFDSCHTPMFTIPLGVDIAINFDSESVFLPELWCAN